MNSERPRWQFTLAQLLALMVVCSMLSCCAMVYLRLTRQSVHHGACINYMRQLGVALHNHHDARKHFPLASTEPITGVPGSYGTTNPAGYSWIVQVLPFMGEPALYDRIAKTSTQFTGDAFDPQNTDPLGTFHVATVQELPLRCPHSRPREVAAENTDYATEGPWNDRRRPAVSSYVANAGSHLTNTIGPGRLPLDAKGREGNGVLVFPSSSKSFGGVTFREITDGMSKTVMLTETVEPAYSAWLDGQVNWVVAAWPGNPHVPGAMNDLDGELGWNAADLLQSYLSLEASSADPAAAPYLPQGRWKGTHPRRWGPSATHRNGAIVFHLFGDTHVVGIDVNAIDKNLYLRMFDRADGSRIELPE